MVKVDIETQRRNLKTEKTSTMDASQAEIAGKTKKKIKGTRHTFWYYWSDYCTSSSIHGMHYLSQNRTIVEYIFWILLLMLSIVGSILMIYNLIQEWVQKPVIVSFATLQQPIFEAPFPAVTICPMNKYDRASYTLDNMRWMKSYKKEFCETKYNKSKDKEVVLVSEEDCYNEELKNAQIAMILCDLSWNEYDNMMGSDNFTEEEFTSFLKKHGLKLKQSTALILDRDMEPNKNDFNDFLKHFKETHTEFGVCYTYNRLRLDEIYRSDVVFLPRDMDSDIPNSEWDPDVGYDSSAGINTYPRRALKVDVMNNLDLELFEEGDNYDSQCEQYEQGYIVILHYPNRLPMKKDDYFFIPLNKQIFVNIRATKMETSNTVMNYSPEKRDCYFSFERYLKYYKYYTSSNCQLECLTNATIAHCNCVEYFMPRDNKTQICGLKQKICAQKYEGEFERLIKIKNSNDKRNSFLRTNCNCLPLCTDVTYKVQIQEVSTRNPSLKLKDLFKGVLNQTIQVSLATFRITSGHMITTERNELYSPMDLIANIGGILGLFTGFSIISFVEIFYYLSLRLIGNRYRHGHWTGKRYPVDNEIHSLYKGDIFD